MESKKKKKNEEGDVCAVDLQYRKLRWNRNLGSLLEHVNEMTPAKQHALGNRILGWT
jgi:hypothetical protein